MVATDRATGPRERILLWPHEVVEQFLVDGEKVELETKPNTQSWLLDRWLEALAGLAIVAIMLVAWDSTITLAGLIFLGGLVAYVIFELFTHLYTRYALTDQRVLRCTGFLRSDHEWISWKKVTDISVHRSFIDRLVGTATIRIQSANELSGFKAMTDVPRPREFAEQVASMVRDKQHR